MAIQISIASADQHDSGITPLGIDLPEAYIKLTALIWHYQPENKTANPPIEGEAHATFGLWASQNARNTGAAPLGETQYVVRNPSMTTDLRAQAYAVIKANGKFFNIDITKGTDV